MAEFRAATKDIADEMPMVFNVYFGFGIAEGKIDDLCIMIPGEELRSTVLMMIGNAMDPDKRILAKGSLFNDKP